MKRLATEVANGNTFSGKVFIVAANVSEITLGDDYIPIGSNTRPFSGTFDGYGVNFQLNLNRATTDYVGLFGFVQSGTIENLSVSGYVKGQNNVGGIVGYLNKGDVRNVYSTASVEGNAQIGGIIGYLREGNL